MKETRAYTHGVNFPLLSAVQLLFVSFRTTWQLIVLFTLAFLIVYFFCGFSRGVLHRFTRGKY